MVDHTADEALAAVQAADAGADSIIALLATKKQELMDALAHAMTPQVQAAINQVFDVGTATAAKIATAVSTPAQ
jgi:predicted LPLAT superfamily acyltransferase